jgi:hypothetical protein
MSSTKRNASEISTDDENGDHTSDENVMDDKFQECDQNKIYENADGDIQRIELNSKSFDAIGSLLAGFLQDVESSICISLVRQYDVLHRCDYWTFS